MSTRNASRTDVTSPYPGTNPTIPLSLRRESWINLLSCIRTGNRIGNFWASVQSLEQQLNHEHLPYGLCPHCGSPGTSRERRPNGNDSCSQGHVYPSSASVDPTPRSPR